MNFSDFYGSFPSISKRWTPFVEVSGNNIGQTSSEELRVDPFLSGQSVDPYDPAGAIAIPAGRFVSIGYSAGISGTGYTTAGAATSANTYRMGVGDRNKTSLTLHDGKNLTPVGLSVNNIFRSAGTNTSGNQTSTGPFQLASNTFGTDSANDASDVKFRRGFVAEVPYVLSINSAHGALVAGDRVTGYWGSTTSTTAIGWMHRGKAVKWTPKQMKYQTQTSSGHVLLTEAVYPGMQPRIVAMFATSTPVAGTPTYTFNGSCWVAELPSACTQVWYEYGQEADQVAGEVLRIQSIVDIASQDYIAKFVELNREGMEWPPATQMVATSLKTNEAATEVTAGRVYRVVNWPISVNHAITIQVQGTVLDDTGVSTTYASSDWYTLPAGNATSYIGQFSGRYHQVNWRTGMIELAANITATAVRVTYSSIVDRRAGAVIWGQGVIGLTDGRYLTTPSSDAAALVPSAGTARAGVPSHLNYADVVGGMRIIVAD